MALGICELALRIAGFSNPNFYQPDPVRGWGLAPGAEGWWTSEGHAFVRINREGERDVEHAVAKRPGVLRVAVLGDSCTEALQVPVEQTFWKRAEPAVRTGARQRGWADAEILNFGVAGYGTAQELLTLRDRVWRYSPDVVVLAFYGGNDVRNNERALEQDPGRPYFLLQPGTGGGQQLVLDDAFRATTSYRLRRSAPARLLYAVFNHSRVLGLAKRGKALADGWIGSAKARTKESGEALQELGLDNAVYAPPHDEDWRRAWAVTEALIVEMNKEVTTHGARFGVLSLTTPIQVDPDAQRRASFMRKLGVTNLDYPDQRLGRLAAAAEIPYLALAPPLRELAEARHLELHGFSNTTPGEGHWNADGHAAAARLMSAWLCSDLIGAR